MENDNKSKDKFRKAKLLYGQEIDDSLLSLYFEIVEQRVKNYCNISTIPTELELIIVEIVVGYCNAKFSESGGNSKDVQSIKRGDTTISYGKTETVKDISISDFVFNYKTQLNKFRKVKLV
ncbi:MAG: hypothetical protein GXZ08_02425 [Tissierellia bacterium]|nr:hypothetical protein [Tissierellia bacterium]